MITPVVQLQVALAKAQAEAASWKAACARGASERAHLRQLLQNTLLELQRANDRLNRS